MSTKMNLMHLQQVLRKKLVLEATDGVFLFIGKNKLQSADKSIGELYDNFKEKDDTLHINCRTVEKF